VTRRGLAWLLALPLAVVGSQLAHGLAYRLVIRDDAELAHELASSGHGYLAYAPVALAVCVALVAFALIRELQGVLARRPSRSQPSALSFAVLAPAIFVSQEYLERLVHEGGFPVDVLLEKTFVLGLALQLPFALAAYVLARLLLRATRAVAWLLAVPNAAVSDGGSRWNLADAGPPRLRCGGPALGARAPPLLAV
jgi:hypothetical protein